VRLVRLLAQQPECTGAEVFGELPLAQSTVSEHLRILKAAEIVHSRSLGTGMVYCVETATLLELAAALQNLADCAPLCSDTPEKGGRP